MTPTQIMQRRIDAIDKELSVPVETIPIPNLARLLEEKKALQEAIAMVNTGDLQPDD